MKLIKKVILVMFILISPIQAGTFTSVETIHTSLGGTMSFSISESKYGKTAFIVVADKYRIKRVYASFNAAKLRRMRLVIDKILKEIE